MHRRLIALFFAVLGVTIVLTGCPGIGAGADSPADGEDKDQVDPADLPVVPDDALPDGSGSGDFYAVLLDTDNETLSLISASAADPSTAETIIADDINPSAPYVRICEDGSHIAYINLLSELVMMDRESGYSAVVFDYSDGADNVDEFWWHGNHALLYSNGGSIARAVMSDGALLTSEIIGSETCHHDLSENPFTAVAGYAQTAFTYISESAEGTHSAVFVGDYVDDGTNSAIESARLIGSYANGFGIAFDPMLTWLSDDVLVWRTDESPTILEYCNIPQYLDYEDPDAWGWVCIEEANAPTEFQLSPDGTAVYFYGRGNVVTSVPNPAFHGTYTAEEFFTDELEYTVSRLEFSPAGNYFLVGNGGRIRCFDADETAVRYRWWEDSAIEQQLDDGLLEVLEIWWI